ncbi:recombinase family protein [Nesterenkonia rhizosphaerae]|uniref:recombinase family protein n=1 Tax=Nesterenkonia rhizosphaerae TaxID=1348272 RepID=UPI003CD06A21
MSWCQPSLVSTVQQAQRGCERDGFSILAHARRPISIRTVSVLSSRRNLKCPEIQRMLTYLQTHQVDSLVVHKFDRLSRSR